MGKENEQSPVQYWTLFIFLAQTPTEVQGISFVGSTNRGQLLAGVEGRLGIDAWQSSRVKFFHDVFFVKARLINPLLTIQEDTADRYAKFYSAS